MKMRNGFVSNSSSSSFVVMCKGNLKTELDAVVEDVKKIKSPFGFGKIAEQIVDTLVNRVTEYKTVAEILNEFCYDEEEIEEIFFTGVVEKMENGWTFYHGSVDDYEPDDMQLVAMEIDHESEALIIKKDSYY